MRELPRTTLKVAQKNLIPDGNRKKPPISNVSPPKEITTRTPRESVTSDLSSSRPNSTASEGGCSTDDENNEGTTECSESGHESSSDDFGGDNRPLDPISEEASLAKRSEDDGYLIFICLKSSILRRKLWFILFDIAKESVHSFVESFQTENISTHKFNKIFFWKYNNGYIMNQLSN